MIEIDLKRSTDQVVFFLSPQNIFRTDHPETITVACELRCGSISGHKEDPDHDIEGYIQRESVTTLRIVHKECSPRWLRMTISEP